MHTDRPDPDIRLNRFLAPFVAKRFQRKLVLIHCPTFNFETFQFEVLRKKGYYAYPPRALQCLSVAVRDLGIETDILDLNFRMLEKLTSLDPAGPVDLYRVLIGILDVYLENNPEVGIFGVSTGVIVPNIFLAERHPFLEVLRHLMETERGLVLAGGPCATIEARNLVEGKWAHAAFKGEAEDRLRYFLGLLFRENGGPSRSGICFLDADEYAESTGSSAMVQFEESLIDTYKTLPVERYHTVGCLSPFSRMTGTEKPYASLQLIRGCRMTCTFCGLTQYRGSNAVCQYPTDVLFNEIEYLVKHRGIRHFEWLDEDFLANRSAVFEILQRIADADFGITWAADIGLIAVYLDEPLLELMARSGCVGFRIGVESGNEQMLKQIRKPATKPKLRAVSQRLHKHPQFFVAGLYMLGFVGETYRQMFDTLEFAIELDLSWSHFCVYQEMKETELKLVSRLDSGARRAEYKDWLPSTQKVVGSSTVGAGSQMTLTARELFALPGESVHANEVKQELWFAFNLVANYLCNKNLRPTGNIDHFIRWLAGLQITYPHHPVMSLFLSLGYLVKGDRQQADRHLDQTRRNLDASDYWRGRFAGYELNKIIEAYPVERHGVSDFLLDIVSGYRPAFSIHQRFKSDASSDLAAARAN
jgi:radical SAM superfamily enzyme YgiQ (UPF0313 family)